MSGQSRGAPDGRDLEAFLARRSLILHESGVPHAGETSEERLLALYPWQDDLVTSPVYVED
jgi:hypothetical protein